MFNAGAAAVDAAGRVWAGSKGAGSMARCSSRFSRRRRRWAPRHGSPNRAARGGAARQAWRSRGTSIVYLSLRWCSRSRAGVHDPRRGCASARGIEEIDDADPTRCCDGWRRQAGSVVTRLARPPPPDRAADGQRPHHGRRLRQHLRAAAAAADPEARSVARRRRHADDAVSDRGVGVAGRLRASGGRWRPRLLVMVGPVVVGAGAQPDRARAPTVGCWR